MRKKKKMLSLRKTILNSILWNNPNAELQELFPASVTNVAKAKEEHDTDIQYFNMIRPSSWTIGQIYSFEYILFVIPKCSIDMYAYKQKWSDSQTQVC